MRPAAAVVAVALWAYGAAALAQVGAGATPGGGARAVVPATSLESRLALGVADRLLASDAVDDWLRAIDRLSGWGRREAIDRLLRALDSGVPPARDGRVRLTAVRVLRGFATRDVVLKFLVKAMIDEPEPGPLSELTQQTAAMALAATEDARAEESLLDALDDNSKAAPWVEAALLAHPPSSFAVFNRRAHISAELCALFGKLGDVRAIPLLRGALARGGLTPAAARKDDVPPPSPSEQRSIRIAAARALASLGDEEQVPVARSWAKSDDPELRAAATPILLASHDRDALAVEGRQGSARSESVATDPVSALQDPARSWDAGYALAFAPSPDAGRVVERALASSESRRLAARAGTVRAVAFGDRARGLVDQLEYLLHSPEPADRATGAWGLALLGRFSDSDSATSPDLPVVRAVARAAWVRGGALARVCATRLAHEPDALTRNSLAIVLALGPPFAEPIATSDLAAWSQSDEPLAPLSALALALRDTPFNQAPIDALLAHDNPVIRAHAAWGLATSPSASAVMRLRRALRFETDARVRRAILQALAVRREPQRDAPLRLAAELDPDPQARAIARAALRAAVTVSTFALGSRCAGVGPSSVPCAAAWIRLAAAPPAYGASTDPSRVARVVGERAGTFRDPSGLALPVVSDPDGALVLVGVSPGSGSFDLASSALWYDALPDDTARSAKRGRGPGR